MTEPLEYILEQKVIGKNKSEVELLIGKKPYFESPDQSIFILKTYCFGIFSKRLYLFFYKNTVRDYYIGI